MTKITSAAYIAAGKTLLALAQRQTIPYAAGGMSLVGMDCQGLCEYLLMDCGVPQSECNLKGSNAHWRACVWTGTPEECVAAFGCVPPGAWVFIVDHEGGGEVARGYTDGLGDAQHMGVYLGGGVALHASAKRGCVAQSDFAEKTVPNGGWNAVGLCPWVAYEGIDTSTEGGREGDGGQDAADSASINAGMELTAGTPSAKQYAIVTSPDGHPVKLRKSPSQRERVYWHVAPGARVVVEKTRGDWALIRALCADGYQRRAYMLRAFLRYEQEGA